MISLHHCIVQCTQGDALSVSTLYSGGVCDGHAVLSGYLPLILPSHLAGGLSGEQAVRI